MLSSVVAYVRQHHLGLIAVVIALGGTTVAASATSVTAPAKHAGNPCPRKTKHFGDYCVRDTGKNLAFRDALALCADKKMRLPSVAEAEYVARGYDLPLPGAHTVYWTSEFDQFDDVIIGAQETGYAGGGTPAPDNSNYVLCVSDA